MKTTIRNFTTASIFFLVPYSIFAKGSNNPALQWVYEHILIVVGMFVISGASMAIWNAISSIYGHHLRKLYAEKGLVMPKKAGGSSQNIIKKFYNKAWSLVPIEKESSIDMGHDYDGIRELDNSLPPWWLYTFYFSILFGVGYIYIYHFSDLGKSQAEEYVTVMEKAKEAKLMHLRFQSNAIDESNVEALQDSKQLKNGATLYLTNCSACHGQGGEGGVGPNLTDPYWIHGGSIQDVFKTIKYGVPQKGMIAWQAQMDPSKIQMVASYILTLQGTNPPNPKAPEGELYESEGLSMLVK